jgi:hypothetical protein
MYEELLSRSLPDHLDEWNDQIHWFNDFTDELKKAVQYSQEQLDISLRETASSKKMHRKDIALISETFINEANERGYCEAYDEVIDKLNKELHCELQTREQEYQITATYIITVQHNTTAKSQADAEEDANSMRLHDFASRVSDFYDIEERDISVRLAN